MENKVERSKETLIAGLREYRTLGVQFIGSSFSYYWSFRFHTAAKEWKRRPFSLNAKQYKICLEYVSFPLGRLCEGISDRKKYTVKINKRICND